MVLDSGTGRDILVIFVTKDFRFTVNMGARIKIHNTVSAIPCLTDFPKVDSYVVDGIGSFDLQVKRYPIGEVALRGLL